MLTIMEFEYGHHIAILMQNSNYVDHINYKSIPSFVPKHIPLVRMLVISKICVHTRDHNKNKIFFTTNTLAHYKKYMDDETKNE